MSIVYALLVLYINLIEPSDKRLNKVDEAYSLTTLSKTFNVRSNA